MRVLFYEPDPTGHHFAYLARMLPGFLELPIEAALATRPEAISTDEFRRTLAPFADRVEVLGCCQKAIKKQPIRNGWRRCRDLAQAIQQWKPDHVCLMYGDGMWPLVAAAQLLGIRLLGRAPALEIWLFRGGFTYPDAKSLGTATRRWLYRRMIRGGLFDRIHGYDELMMQYHEAIPGNKTEMVLSPESVMIRPPVDQDTARDQLGLPAAGKIISATGMITRRKGVELVLEAFARHAPSRSDSVLLLAGPHEDHIQTKLEEPPFEALRQAGRLISLDRFLTEEEMLLAAEASDLVLAPYPNHSGRSSIILWAAAAGTPVLGVKRGCIGHVIRTENLGQTCDVLDLKDFTKAMTQMLNEPWSEEDQQRVREYAQTHSIENYQQQSAALVRSRCEALGKI